MNVELVSIVIGTEKKKQTKTVDFTNTSGKVSFTYAFEQDDSFPVTILINNEPVLGFLLEVSE